MVQLFSHQNPTPIATSEHPLFWHTGDLGHCPDGDLEPIPEITRQPVSTYLRRCDAASRLAAAMPRPVRDGGSGVEATA